VIGGTGFIGTQIVWQLARQGHDFTVYNRGLTQSVLPDNTQYFIDSNSVTPITHFPNALFDREPEVVILTVAMGAVDAKAAVKAFAGRVGRIVLLSSGDVYRAYGRLIGVEAGPIQQGLLTEESPLRSKMYPYRQKAASRKALEYWYEKILAERAVRNVPDLPATILRLPKVYGPGGNSDLATVYRYRHHPEWRWTHGFVGNVAAAIVLAATHPAAAGRIYNVGEEYTPPIAERLAWLPPSSIAPDLTSEFDFNQDIAYDTTRIRTELGYREIVPEQEATLTMLQRGAKGS
jgi:nucleoside-diphosphate-sugar epimerase